MHINLARVASLSRGKTTVTLELTEALSRYGTTVRQLSLSLPLSLSLSFSLSLDLSLSVSLLKTPRCVRLLWASLQHGLSRVD